MQKPTQYSSRIIFSIFLIISITTMSCSESIVDNTELTQDEFTSNDLSITELIIGEPNTAGDYRMITFNIQWNYSWRTNGSPYNWDAAWVFIKYKAGSDEWKHASLSLIPSEHNAPQGAVIDPPSDGKGVFIYRSGNGNGTFVAPNVSLRWNCGQDNVPEDAVLDVRVFGIEMVYIPEGSFYAGDNGTSYASLTKGSNDNRPWLIENENAIEVTNTESDGFYYNSSKDYWNERWNASEDLTGTEFTIPAEFPKGYQAIYCMKYEMNQQQYVDFLNTLNSTQAANRYDISNYNNYGYTILLNNGVYSTTEPLRACGFISPSDGCAYADWAGLRPMSELEFEKICRGSGNQPVEGEFAWGTTYSRNASSAIGNESDREHLTNIGANSYYSEENFNGQFPLNTGIFSGPEKSREMSGSSFYGVMEMSGNVNETCISIGTSFGRVFSYHNGDGQLASDGFSDENNWPQQDGRGAGYKGGNFAREAHEMRISERLDATVEIDYDHRHIPLGFRGVRTVIN